MRNWLHISHSEKRRGLDWAKIRWSKERELVFFLFLLLAPVDLILIAWHWSNIPLCIAERLLGCSAVWGSRRVWQTGTWEVDEDCHPARMTALFCDCDETSPFCTGCSKPIQGARLLFQDGLYVGFPRVWGIVVKLACVFSSNSEALFISKVNITAVKECVHRETDMRFVFVFYLQTALWGGPQRVPSAAAYRSKAIPSVLWSYFTE